jgi:hypothetical protein
MTVPMMRNSVSISSVIVEEIKNIGESALIMYYYFDFRDATKRTIRGLLTSVVMQLADSDASDKCRDILSKFHTECKYGSEQPSETALAQCLKRMLDSLGQVPVYIIVDALDECPDNIGTPSARAKVLDFIEKLIQANHPNLFICLTSRPEQDISDVFNPLTSESRRVSLHDESGQQEDINNYLRHFVRTDKAMRRWREEDKQLVINTLSEKAGGM